MQKGKKLCDHSCKVPMQRIFEIKYDGHHGA